MTGDGKDGLPVTCHRSSVKVFSRHLSPVTCHVMETVLDTRAIQAYLGHRSIMSTVRYTALTPNRFKNFWKD